MQGEPRGGRGGPAGFRANPDSLLAMPLPTSHRSAELAWGSSSIKGQASWGGTPKPRSLSTYSVPQTFQHLI